MSIWPGVGRKSVVVVVVDATGTMSFLSVLSLPRCARAVHLDECRVAGLRRRCAAADGLWCTGGRAGGRVAGRTLARDPTLARALWNPYMMMTTPTAEREGASESRSGAESVGEVLPD